MGKQVLMEVGKRNIRHGQALTAGIVSALIAIMLAFLPAMASARADAYSDPAPELAQDNPISKQVAETVVYTYQEEAEAISKSVKESMANSAEAGQGRSTETVEQAMAEPLAEITEGNAVEGNMEPGTISVAGDVVPFQDSYESAAAPARGAGLWMGSDSTTDGSWGYFIGHNPGDFCCVMALSTGDAVTVCDRDGNERTYRVIDTFDVPDTTYWEDISYKVDGYGESIALQTCCGDGEHYRVVVAK